MKISDEIEVNIEKLSNLGFGLAKHEGLVVFVENSCPGDKLKVQITKLNKNFANARIVKIISGSKHRVEPFCAMQNICGGCQLQFIDYDYQLKLKKEIIEDALKTIGNINTEVQDVIPSPQKLHYRHKVQYPVTQTKVSKRILAGYYKPKSHEIVNIKFCPIQPEICDKIIEFIRASAFHYRVSGYDEQTHTGDLRHVVIRLSEATGKILITLVVNSTKIIENLKNFARNIYENFEEISGVYINLNNKQTNVIMSEETELIIGEDVIKEKILDKNFKIGPRTFFQVNPQSAQNIFAFVKDYVSSNFKKPLILDAYAGVTAFGIILSDIGKKIISVEENIESVNLASEIIALNNIKNIELYNMDTKKFFAEELKAELDKFDVIILDPPRKGCSEECLNYVMNYCRGNIIYVSCNPATLARDLKYLVSKGAKVDFIKPFDMFCHTYHIESVAIISISK